MWSNWSIYWTLDNFSKHLTTINLPKSSTFLGNLATLYWSHCWVLSSLNNLIVKHMRNVTSMHVLNKYVWLFINTTTAFLFGRYCFASPSTYSSFVIKNVVCFKCQLPPHGKQGVEISVTRCWNKKVTIVLPMLPKKKPWQILHKM